MVDDPLPAGFEIDNPNLLRGGDIASLDWLDADRCRACRVPRRPLPRGGGLAVGQAASGWPISCAPSRPAPTTMPAASVEDMYRPQMPRPHRRRAGDRHGGAVSGRTVATAIWRRSDREGTDRCRLARTDEGWLLIGHARWTEDGAEMALDYAVRAAPDWTSLGADVSGMVGGTEIALRIDRAEGFWRMNGDVLPDDALPDLDFGFTPATNLLPLRRLDLGEGPVSTSAAWLDLRPDRVRLTRLDQSYTRRSDAEVDYASPAHGFGATLTVAPCGFVTDYPGLWHGSVETEDV